MCLVVLTWIVTMAIWNIWTILFNYANVYEDYLKRHVAGFISKTSFLNPYFCVVAILSSCIVLLSHFYNILHNM